MRGLLVVVGATICAGLVAGYFILGHGDIVAAGQAAVKKLAREPGRSSPAAPAAPAPPSEQPEAPPVEAVAAPQPPAAPATTPVPAEPPAPQPGATAAAPQPKPAVRIALPPALAGLQFGMSADAISGRFPISWTRDRAGTRTLVHYPEGPGGTQVRFEFAAQGLCGIELYMKPPEGKTPAQFQQDVRKEYEAVYSGLPGSAATGWNDGHCILSIALAPAHVVVSFRPAG